MVAEAEAFRHTLRTIAAMHRNHGRPQTGAVPPPGHEERITEYTERASRGEPLFG